MICFPLDNTEYEANALGAWCGTRTRGVFSADGHYTVTANNDMTVTVSPGLAWLKAGQFWGVTIFESNPVVLEIDTADGSLSRVDAVCVRLDKNQNRGEIVIKKGGYSPQPPAITPPVRTLDYDEIYVATIAVGAGATSIGQVNVTDQRLNEDYCGIMRDGVTGIPTQQLQSQWESWLSAFSAEAQSYYQQYQAMVADLYLQYAAEIAVRGDDAQQAFDDFSLRMTTYEQTAQAEFAAWFESIQDVLDQDTAGHLQNEIDALPDTFYTKVISDQRLAAAVSAHNTDPAAHSDTGQRIAAAVSAHNTDPVAHGDTRQSITDLESRTAELEAIIGPAIDADPSTTILTALEGKADTPLSASSLPSSGTALTANTVYTIASGSPINTYQLRAPVSGWAHGSFTVGTSPAITFATGSTYVNQAPVFTASTRYEFDVINGVWAFARVSS